MKIGKILPLLLSSAMVVSTFAGTAAAADTEENPAAARLDRQVGLSDDWEPDRTEPVDWNVDENTGIISFKTNPAISGSTTTKGQTGYKFEAWQGESAETDMEAASHWRVETEINLETVKDSNQAAEQSPSVWLEVQDGTGADVDWAILQFNKDGGAPGWQWWDSTGPDGSWHPIDEDVSETGDWHKVAIEFDNGTITEWIDENKVKSYPIGDDPENPVAETKAARVFFESYSYTGQAPYTSEWKVPVISSGIEYDTLPEAVDAAEDGDTVNLLRDVETGGTVSITRPLVLDGNGHKISVSKDISEKENGSNSVLELEQAGEDNLLIQNLTIDASNAKHGVNVFECGNVTLKDVTVEGAQGAGVIVNSSAVQLEGAIRLDQNAWGGINVSYGSNPTEGYDVKPQLTLQDCDVEYQLVKNTPPIWVDLPASENGEYNSDSALEAGKNFFDAPGWVGIFVPADKDHGPQVLYALVSGFEPLADAVKTQRVSYNTPRDSLNLPSELSAKVTGEENADVTISGITWESEPDYSPATPGTYTFTAVVPILPADYALEKDIALPTITVTVAKKSSGSSGSSGSSSSGSTGTGTAVTPSAEPTYVSDTTSDFPVSGTYQFRITSKNGAVPNLVVGTAGVFDTQLVQVSGNDYFFKLIAIGKPGDKAGIYVNGVKLLVATVGATAPTVKSDTSGAFNVGSGKAYLFKLTADTQPNFGAGSPSFSVVFVIAAWKDYFFRVTAIGEVGASCGFYINLQQSPVAVATITR